MRKTDHERLFRVYHRLADGRVVYFSKRGMIHLMTRAEAEAAVEMSRRNRDPAGNPGVYGVGLDIYGSRSLFLESLSPFVAVEGTAIEPAAMPIDPAAFILGPVPATRAGTYARAR